MNTMLLTSFIFISFYCLTSWADTCGDPITCYLSSLQELVPDQSIDVSGKKLHLKNTICNHFGLGSIPSSYTLPSSLGIGITQGSLICKGDYTYEIFKGSVTATIDHINVISTLHINENNSIPISVDVPNCSVSSIDIDLKFTGNIATSILSLIIPLVKNHIENTLKKTLCEELIVNIAQNGTYTLQTQVDPFLNTVINAQPLPPPTFTSPMLNWHTLYHDYSTIIDTIIHEYPKLSSMFKLPNMNRLIDIFTHNTGSLLIPLQEVITIHEKNHITVTGIEIQGIDSWNNLMIDTPTSASNTSLSSSIGLNHLHFILNMTYVTSIPSGIYEEDIQLHVTVSNVTLYLIQTLAINENTLKKLYYDQVTEWNCLLTTVEDINITSLTLNATIDHIHVSQIGGTLSTLETNIIDLVDNMMDLVTYGSQPLIQQTISGICQYYLRDFINMKLTSFLTGLKQLFPCHTHQNPYPSTSTMNWSHNYIIQVLNMFVNHNFGALEWNTIIKVLTHNTGSLYYKNDVLELALHGLDSIQYITLLQPESAALISYKSSNLMNHFYIGECQTTLCKPFSMKIHYEKPHHKKTPISYETYTDNTMEISTRTSNDSENDNNSILKLIENVINELFSNNLVTSSSSFTNVNTINFDYPLESNTNKIYQQLLSSFTKNMLSVFNINPDNFTFELQLSNFYTYINLNVLLNIYQLHELQIQEMMIPACLLSTFDDFSMNRLRMDASSASVIVDSQLKYDITSYINDLMLYLSGENDVITRVNNYFQKQIKIANSTCSQRIYNNQSYPPPNVDNNHNGNTEKSTDVHKESTLSLIFDYLIIFGAFITFIVLSFIFWWLNKYRVYRNKYKTTSHHIQSPRIQSGSSGSNSTRMTSPSISFITRYQSIVKWFQEYRYMKYEWHKSLIGNKDLSLLLRLFIIILCMVNILFYIQSNMASVASNVILSVKIGNTTSSNTIFSMGLVRTVNEMWRAKTYGLAILIAFFSGGWPYIKVMSMFLAFTLPPDLLPPSLRQQILKIMDVLGKWSLVDCFVMIIFACAFYFKLPSFFKEYFEINVYVQSEWAFHQYIIAILMSLALGHIIIACHRYVIYKEIQENIKKTKQLQHQLNMTSLFSPTDSSTSTISIPMPSLETQYTQSINQQQPQQLLEKGGKNKYNRNDIHQQNDSFPICPLINTQIQETSLRNMNSMITREGEDIALCNHHFLLSYTLLPKSYRYLLHTTTPLPYTPLLLQASQPVLMTPTHMNPLMNSITSTSTTNKIMNDMNRSSDIDAQKASLHASLIQIKLTKLGKFLIFIWLNVTIICLILGTIFNTFEFTFQGLTGLILGDKSTISYSVYSMGQTYPSATGTPTVFSVYLLVTCYYLFGMIMPLITAWILLVIWFVPVSLSSHEWILTIVEIVNAWSGLDVFCIALIASVLELPLFSAFILGHKCDGVQYLINRYFSDIVQEKECFNVISSVRTESWILFLAVTLFFFISVNSLYLLTQSIEDRQALLQGKYTYHRQYTIQPTCPSPTTTQDQQPISSSVHKTSHDSIDNIPNMNINKNTTYMTYPLFQRLYQDDTHSEEEVEDIHIDEENKCNTTIYDHHENQLHNVSYDSTDHTADLHQPLLPLPSMNNRIQVHMSDTNTIYIQPLTFQQYVYKSILYGLFTCKLIEIVSMSA